MDPHRKMIDDHYGGNENRFHDAFADAAVKGRRDMIQWSDLATAATTLPDLESDGQNLIEEYLGYLPSDKVILPYEPFMRGLIHACRQGQLTDDAFHEQVTDHVRLIRNADMTPNLCLTYAPEIYADYNETYPVYGHAVKSRLTHFLGYEPKLEHSLVVEMWMRGIMGKDTYKLPPEITAVDYKGIILIKYREILLEKGKVAADLSPLLWS